MRYFHYQLRIKTMNNVYFTPEAWLAYAVLRPDARIAGENGLTAIG